MQHIHLKWFFLCNSLFCMALSLCPCSYATRGAAGIRGQAEGCWREHEGPSWTGESSDPLHRLPAGLHRARERPGLLELSAAGQVSWSQVSKAHLFLGLEWLLYTSVLLNHLSIKNKAMHFAFLSFKSPFSKLLFFSSAELPVLPPSQSIWLCRLRNSHSELTGCRRN